MKQQLMEDTHKRINIQMLIQPVLTPHSEVWFCHQSAIRWNQPLFHSVDVNSSIDNSFALGNHSVASAVPGRTKERKH